MNKTYFLLVDLQKDYFPGGAQPLENSEERVRKTQLVLETARAHDIAIIHIRHESLGPLAPIFRPGTGGIEFHPAVAPKEGEPVITKHERSGYAGTTLEEELRRGACNTVLIAGMQTNKCYAALAKDSVKLGFRTLILSDCAAASSEEIHRETLRELEAIVQGTLRAEEAIQALEAHEDL